MMSRTREILDLTIQANKNLAYEADNSSLTNDVEIGNIAFEDVDKSEPTVNQDAEASTSSLRLCETQQDPGNTFNCSEDKYDCDNEVEDIMPPRETGCDNDDSDTEVEGGDINEGRKRKKVANKSEENKKSEASNERRRVLRLFSRHLKTILQDQQENWELVVCPKYV
ncbi:hypothetical protein QE152_g8014 [Popillia japonica]|uniref:Uncharacterized protein n=1 Tax=Popillia japonica TaxID=7064 RepID=A0AAW1MCW5_POPJA